MRLPLTKQDKNKAEYEVKFKVEDINVMFQPVFFFVVNQNKPDQTKTTPTTTVLQDLLCLV